MTPGALPTQSWRRIASRACAPRALLIGGCALHTAVRPSAIAADDPPAATVLPSRTHAVVDPARRADVDLHVAHVAEALPAQTGLLLHSIRRERFSAGDLHRNAKNEAGTALVHVRTVHVRTVHVRTVHVRTARVERPRAALPPDWPRALATLGRAPREAPDEEDTR